MLIDDDPDDNFIHERVIRKSNAAEMVIAMKTASSALEYLKSKEDINNTHPDLIFLDINMPGMNGWEFLQEYNKLDIQFRSQVIIIMLTTSDNPTDKMKATLANGICAFKTKPLTKEMLEEIRTKYFK
jgi:response regulator of citrate/malate metabolism